MFVVQILWIRNRIYLHEVTVHVDLIYLWKISWFVAKMPAHVANTEPNQVVSRSSRNNIAHTNNSPPAANNDTSHLEAGRNVEDESSSTTMVPDGGWGWMVVLGAFLTFFICHGFILSSFGVFVEDFVDYFESSKSAVGGVGSLMIAINTGSGNTW